MINSEMENRLSDDELEKIHSVVISVIGPTNEGKTSILRTLTGDPNFGDINARTGTTVRTEYIRILYKNRTEILRLADTPGFQMSGAIADRLDSNGGRSVAAIRAAIPDGDDDFLHDRRAWAEVAQSDIVIYAANTAESPQQSLTADSLYLLGRVEKPVIVLFNAVASQTGPDALSDYRTEWIEVLQKSGLHLYQNFDAHRRKFADEYRLFEKICSLIHDPLSRKGVRAELSERVHQEQDRIIQSRRLIAEMMLDMAEMTVTAEEIPETQWKQKGEELREKLADAIAEREHKTHQALLGVWQFQLGILEKHHLLTHQDLSERDHYLGQKWLKHSGSGAAAGAAIGLVVDVLLGGASLGAGTAIGTAIGGFFGGTWNAVYDKKNKKLTVRLNPSNYQPLLARSVELANKLQERGQAVAGTIALILSSEPKKIEASEFLRLLNQLTASPEGIKKIQGQLQKLKRRYPWDSPKPIERNEKISSLADQLQSLLPDP